MSCSILQASSSAVLALSLIHIYAKKDGIHGKATTPYLLAKIKDLTGGDSLDSNIQLVFNTARLGAAAAVELAKLER